MFYNLGSGSLASWDEALYASVAKEIWIRGDWLRLYFSGALWFDKPPLAMWVTACFYHLFGVSEFSSRLFSALCGTGTVWILFIFGRRLWGEWAGVCGALMFATSSFFIRTGRFGTLDSPLTFFLMLSFYSIWRGRHESRWIVWAGVFFGLAFMVKGFAALIFFPAVFLFALSAREERLFLKKEWLGFILAAVVIIFPWHLFQTLEFPDKFFRNVVAKHLLERTTHAIEGHAGDSFFYLRVVLNKFRPAIFLGVAAIPLFIWKTFRLREPALFFVTAWILSGFAITLSVQTKLDWYIYPFLPALSLAIGWVFSQWVRPRWMAALAVVSILSVWSHGFHSHRFFQNYSAPIKAMAGFVQENVPKESPVYLIRYHEDPAVAFYWERRCMDLDDVVSLEAALARGSFYGFIRAEDYEGWRQIFEKNGASIRQKSNGFYWVTTVV